MSSLPFEVLITPETAAALLGIHPETLMRWSRSGRVPFHRIGRKIMFRASKLNEWLNEPVQSLVANRAA
jgi:excisionase family DNA binding protein